MNKYKAINNQLTVFPAKLFIQINNNFSVRSKKLWFCFLEYANNWNKYTISSQMISQIVLKEQIKIPKHYLLPFSIYLVS